MSRHLSPHGPRLAPYRYGSTKWDDHLGDIHRAIAESATAQITVAKENATASAEGLAGMRADMNWGFTLLHDQGTEQLRRMDAILDRLRAIEDVLRAPTLTRAREAYSLGRQHIRQGLFAKAMEEFTRAERLHDVDFLLHFTIGKLRLYGKAGEEDVVDLDAAEHHLLLSRKYATAAKVDLLGQVDPYVAEANYHLAIVEYLRGSDRLADGDQEAALKHLKSAIAFLKLNSPASKQHRFFQARCHTLAGDGDGAVSILSSLADDDRRYVSLALEEPDFNGIAATIREIPSVLRIQPGPATSAALGAWAAASAAIESAAMVDEVGAHRRELQDLARRLDIADAALDSGTATTLHTAAAEIRKAAVAVGVRTYQAKISELAARIRQLEASASTEIQLAKSKRPFADVELLQAVFVGMAILWGVVMAILSPDNAAVGWSIWGLMSMGSTLCIIRQLQGKYDHAQEIARSVQADVDTIKEQIRVVTSDQQLFVRSNFTP